MHREIDIQTRTLYAELLELLQVMEASRSISNLKGSFSTKPVKGEEYVYFRTYAPNGQRHEMYVGRRNEQTEQLMRDHAENKADTTEMLERLKRLSVQIRAGAHMPTDKAMTRVIQSLADSGVFRNGGVLIGTHAFQAAGLALGVSWTNETTMTTDVDLAMEQRVTVALPRIDSDIPATLESLQMGFFAVPRLNYKESSTTFAIRKNQLRLDLLTPKTGESESPVFIKRFNCAATPVSYLAYLIESPINALLLDTIPILITIPQPARYALHKLIVSQVRNIGEDAKRPKDLHQAHQILTLLQDIRPFDIQPAWENLLERGPKWRKYAEAGLAAMERLHGKVGIT